MYDTNASKSTHANIELAECGAAWLIVVQDRARQESTVADPTSQVSDSFGGAVFIVTLTSEQKRD
ncbi:hypothetical protein AMJ85_00325 [candidate division BRC1 bacterium SM23_51]|nr:MAG: hypothetical protein AMJ85_00325 [candidate division BRC1 bacterium SM23_51]